MAIQTLNNNEAGSAFRVKLNDMFVELYASVAAATIGEEVQAFSTHLDAIAALAKTDGGFIVANGTTFALETGATARTSLGLGTAAVEAATAFATAAQGDTADSALQPGDEASVVVVDATTARTLALTDAQGYIRCTSADAVTVTVAPTAEVEWPANTEVTIEQAGVGQVTVAAGSGVTLRTPETLLAAKQYAVIRLKRVALNEWVLEGNLQASA